MINFRSNGLTCIVKCHTQHVLDVPPPIGSLLTVKHSGFLKNGTLRHPFYWRSTEQLPLPLVIRLKEMINGYFRNIHLIGENKVIKEICLI
jgi:hypothetical protein